MDRWKKEIEAKVGSAEHVSYSECETHCKKQNGAVELAGADSPLVESPLNQC